ncbi:MAG: 4Fe-4S dicluster domain-containing protein, partial [Buchnera aphidicola]|nr:4Fe-4S dicluster domain-containing protein [Buchnera aphidicola]
KILLHRSVESPCIRCGYCAQVCPVNLLPQQLYFYSKNKNHEKTKEHHILDCIECRVCEKVCPSNIPLVTYFHIEKKIQYYIDVNDVRKKIAIQRFRMREERLL